MVRPGQRGKVVLAGLTPFVDTLFLLLFALLALSDPRKAHGAERVQVRLPHVEPGEGGGAVPSILLEITADAAVRVGDDALPVESREELDRALGRLLGERLPEEAVIEIHADRDAPYGVALELLQHIRLRGFADVRLVALAADGKAQSGRVQSGPFGEAR